MASKSFGVGDLVWAKMKGFPAWPARITKSSKKPKKGKHYFFFFFFFFGSGNYAWIMDSNVVPHTDSMVSSTKKRSVALQKAVEALLKYKETYVHESDYDYSDSETLETKDAQKIGFLGLGHMGQKMVLNLLNTGHQVTVWNRSPGKVESFVEAGANRSMTPADVVTASDITFCCLSYPEAAKAMVFGNWVVLKALQSCDVGGKGYVEMTSIDPDTSRDIFEAITSNGGKYLEAPVIGTKKQAEEGTLFILVAGDKSLFENCKPCFRAMGNNTYYVSKEIPNGSKMNLILSMFVGTTCAALSEAMALVEKTSLSPKAFIKILSLLNFNIEEMQDKADRMLTKNFSTNTALKHMQKDLNFALMMGNSEDHIMPLAAAANEIYKHAKHLGFSDHDVSAV
ncbi:putative oxidoreductase GLYR1 homolog [Stegodyphus dumicola]|uniref:putative oxidoreductase GLYR1 homolog n=1 Tax=Stegodyphus dumicola TaxID=202533 RepID=UPI0015ACF431|nr:putative oxidoreductase GLYR1 homolog [Stegodyphus dumicola]